jgi:hypothetical protein
MASFSKICRTCSIEKPITEFHKHTSTKDGHRNECGSCTTKAVNRWRLRNPDKVKANVEKHRNKRREAAKRWREQNPDKVREQRERAKQRRRENRNG